MDDALTPQLPDMGRSESEVVTLNEMVDFYRAVLARKCSGLQDSQMAATVGPSTMTLGGLLHHLAFVEDFWFDHRWAGNDPAEPWLSVDWDADPDWDWRVAADLSADQIRAQFDASVARSREIQGSASSLEDHAAIANQDGTPLNLRWIMVHMVEEYARHAGHADLLRESIDGVVGD